jgi:HD-GYP domain-containing protein (c-di-GMP phosphodiesterase class II)
MPLEVLHKKSALDEVETELMRKHSKFGATIAHLRKLPDEICDAILFHHERFDGGGYPYGLKGVEIPLASRIIAVVDAYDTIVNERCYHEAQSGEIARAEIFNCAGTQFDPWVAEKFLDLLEVINARRGELAAA